MDVYLFILGFSKVFRNTVWLLIADESIIGILLYGIVSGMRWSWTL